MPRRTLAVGDLVTVELHINKWAEILIEMELLGEDDEPLQGVFGLRNLAYYNLLLLLQLQAE